MMAIMMKEFLTVEEIADKLQLSSETVKRLLRTKRMAGYKISGVWRVTPQDFENYLASTRNIPIDQDK